MRISGVVCLATILLASAEGWMPGAAAPDPVLSGPWSLEDAVTFALGHNRTLLQVLEEKRISSGIIVEARSEALPKVDLEGHWESRDRENQIQFDEASGQGESVSVGFRNDSALDLNLTQTLYRGGSIRALIRASKLAGMLADERVRGAVQETIYQTTRAYLRVLLLQQDYEVALNFVRLSESHLADTETKRKYGVASDFNVLRSQVELSNARAESIAFKNRLGEARADLLRITGASQDSDVALTGALPYEPTTAEEQAAIREALEKRPDISQATLEIGLQREMITGVRSEYFPRLDAYFTQTFARPDPRILNLDDWGDAWAAGLQLRFELFNGLRTRGRLIQEQARLRQQELDLEDTRARARFEVRKALLALRDAAEAVEVQKQTVDQAKEGLRIAEVGYRQGTLDQVSVLDSRAALTRAQLLFLTALEAHAVARLDLEKAKGTLVPPGSPPEER